MLCIGVASLHNWDSTIPFPPHMLKWAHTREKILSQVGINPSTSRFWGRWSTSRATVADDLCSWFGKLSEMRPYGLQPTNILHCRLIPFTGFCRQTAQPYILLIDLFYAQTRTLFYRWVSTTIRFCRLWNNRVYWIQILSWADLNHSSASNFFE